MSVYRLVARTCLGYTNPKGASLQTAFPESVRRGADMMLNLSRDAAKSRGPLWGLWSKSLVVGCLLSSAAMLAQPTPAHARNGMNGFMAGAILGGAMRGFGPPNMRPYRPGRGASTSRRSTRHARGSRSKQVEEAKKEEPAEKVFGPSTIPTSARSEEHTS